MKTFYVVRKTWSAWDLERLTAILREYEVEEGWAGVERRRMSGEKKEDLAQHLPWYY